MLVLFLCSRKCYATHAGFGSRDIDSMLKAIGQHFLLAVALGAIVIIMQSTFGGGARPETILSPIEIDRDH